MNNIPTVLSDMSSFYLSCSGEVPNRAHQRFNETDERQCFVILYV